MLDSEVASRVDTETLTMVFDGPKYQGMIGADELGRVLIAFSDYSQAISETVKPGSHVEVRVSAFEAASFDAILALIQHAAIAGVTAEFLLRMFKFYWQHMRKTVKSYQQIADQGVVKVTFTSGEVLEMTEDEWRLFNNKRVRKTLGKIVAPLRAGATSLTLTSGTDKLEIPASDAALFDEPVTVERTVARREVWAQPDTVRFDPDKRWRFRAIGLDAATFIAGFEDEQFKTNLTTGRITVGKNDKFKLRVRVETEPTEDGRRETYAIEEVIEHEPGASQDELPPFVGESEGE